MGDEQGRKRKKNYYMKGGQDKRAKYGLTLQPGFKGFLITCNNREKEAVKEAYNILGEYAEKIYGTDQASVDDDETSEEEEEDIEAALKKEVSDIKHTKPNLKKFQVVKSGAKNCVFIKTTLNDPEYLLLKLLHDVLETQKARSRFIMRIHPVIGSCKADEERVGALINTCLAKYMLGNDGKSYCILVKVRNNTDFGKSQVFPVMRRIIQEMNPSHRFDDKNPDYVFFMDVIKNVCCLSVMEDYHQLRKYNIQELIKVCTGPSSSERSAKDRDEQHSAMNTAKGDTGHDSGTPVSDHMVKRRGNDDSTHSDNGTHTGKELLSSEKDTELGNHDNELAKSNFKDSDVAIGVKDPDVITGAEDPDVVTGAEDPDVMTI